MDENFKFDGARVFAENQASAMGTQKGHLLDHIIPAFLDLWSIENHYTDFFETA